MATENRKILHIVNADLANLANKQIGVQENVDSELGYRMWGGKDSLGNVTYWAAKNKPAYFTTMRLTGGTTSGASGFVRHSASGDLTGGVLNFNEIDDVSAGSPSDGDTIVYNSTAGEWQTTPADFGALEYKGTWDASTNTPTLGSSGVGGVKGDVYIVSVAGSTMIDGEDDWKIKDWIVHNGSTWDKIDNTESVVSVNGMTGAVQVTFDSCYNQESGIHLVTVDDGDIKFALDGDYKFIIDVSGSPPGIPNGSIPYYGFEVVSGTDLFRVVSGGTSDNVKVFGDLSTFELDCSSRIVLKTADAIYGSITNGEDLVLKSNSTGANGQVKIADTLYVDEDVNRVGVGIASPSYKFSIGSTDTSDQIGFYHDNLDAYFTTTDGNFIFLTDEGTNTNSILEIKGLGTGYGVHRTYDGDESNYLEILCQSTNGRIRVEGSLPGVLQLQNTANNDVSCFQGAVSGETRELKIYGFKVGDASRSLEIGVGVDYADTASFDGVSSYYFDGDIKTLGKMIIRETDDGNDAVVLESDTDEGYLKLKYNGSDTVVFRGAGNCYIDNDGYRFGVGTSDLDGTPAAGRLVVKGTTSDGSSNIQVWRDVSETNVAYMDTDGNFDLLTGAKLSLYESDDTEYLELFCDTNKGYIRTAGASAGVLELQDTAHSNVTMFANAESSETPVLKIFGYGAGDAKRSLQFSCGEHASDTASINGTTNVYINSNVGVKTFSPTAVLDINGDIMRLRTSKTPATAGASGNTGDICWDSNYIYVCVAASTWKRASIATW